LERTIPLQKISWWKGPLISTGFTDVEAHASTFLTGKTLPILKNTVGEDHSSSKDYLVEVPFLFPGGKDRSVPPVTTCNIRILPELKN